MEKHAGEKFWSRTQLPWAYLRWKLTGLTSKDLSSFDHLRVWEPVPRAPFREPQSLLQVVAGVGQGVGWKLGLKAPGEGSGRGPHALAPYRE